MSWSVITRGGASRIASGATALTRRPADRAARAHCRAVCGEMHSGFVSLRSALPMNLKGRFPGYKVWSRAQSDIERVYEIWRECLATYGGPYLFGARSMADAMYAPVVTRFDTYGGKLDPDIRSYVDAILATPAMKKWYAGAAKEPWPEPGPDE